MNDQDKAATPVPCNSDASDRGEWVLFVMMLIAFGGGMLLATVLS